MKKKVPNMQLLQDAGRVLLATHPLRPIEEKASVVMCGVSHESDSEKGSVLKE